MGHEHNEPLIDWSKKKSINFKKYYSLTELRRMPRKLYYATRHWREFRMEIIALHDHKCAICGKMAKIVHHNHYESIGQEQAADVELLCSSCHTSLHKKGIKL
jgi:5-methylcytosine-specific restriction endonuclease McrA